ncbi:MAG: hypothetical protein AB1491_06880 [Thermodesulfobacteriota bacterium]
MVTDSGVRKKDEERFQLAASLIQRYDNLQAALARRAVFLLVVNALLLLGLVLSINQYFLGAQQYSFGENILLYLFTVSTIILLVLSSFYALEALRVDRQTGGGPPASRDFSGILFFNPQDTLNALGELPEFSEKFRSTTREQMRAYAEAELFSLSRSCDKQEQALQRARRFLLLALLLFAIYLVVLSARFF